jgi:hypothetical protein
MDVFGDRRDTSDVDSTLIEIEWIFLLEVLSDGTERPRSQAGEHYQFCRKAHEFSNNCQSN